ncbi:MAG: glycosyltransferase family 2 protein [Candidatus Melainabacteria bacterium]|nr:glycosyltransferase family 2 protein [Candidatus Melainabacteria bacterium]
MVGPVFSVVLPIYNEQENLPELYRRLTDVMQGLAQPYELVFVDDGSRDDSVKMIKDLRAGDEAVKLVALSRNFGHQPAVSAGLALAAGQAVIVMDSDLQDSPDVIPMFVQKWREGYQVVYAIRQTRHEGMLKNFAYRLFYRILKHLSETEIPVDSGDFSLMDRRVVDLINRLPEKTRYIRGLRAWVGFKQTGVLVDRPSRHAGAPKYTLYRLILLALSGVISFSVIPLRFATGLGVLVSFLSFASIIVIVAIRLFTTLSIPGFAATASILLFLGGVQLLTVGILGEYVGRIFDEVKGRPLFIVSEALGLENDR